MKLSFSPSLRPLADRLRADVEAICLPRGRVTGSPGHKKVRAYLTRRLEKTGCVPFNGKSFDIPYQAKGKTFHNLIGVVRGADPELAPLLVGAHYDSAIPEPCADDNAAAVAIALAAGEEAARTGRLERDLIVAIFDAEEPPHFCTESMGSIRFWHDQRGGRKIHAALVMDLVGHDVSVPGSMLGDIPRIGPWLEKIPGLAGRDIPLPILHPLLFVTGSESHPELQDVVDAAPAGNGLKVVPTLNRYVGDMSDHGVFRENGVPYLFLSCGRWTHYHKRTDTPDRLNYRKMARIANQASAYLSGLSARPLRRTGEKERITDTLELEVRHMRRAFGPLWPLLLKHAKLTDIGSRSEMNKLVKSLLSLGL